MHHPLIQRQITKIQPCEFIRAVIIKPLMIVEFSSGAEVSFGSSAINISDDEIELQNMRKMRDLISYLYRNYEKSQNTLFKEDSTLSPGIVCFINEVDWQILGCEDADIDVGLRILFLSTMHGG